MMTRNYWLASTNFKDIDFVFCFSWLSGMGVTWTVLILNLMVFKNIDETKRSVWVISHKPFFETIFALQITLYFYSWELSQKFHLKVSVLANADWIDNKQFDIKYMQSVEPGNATCLPVVWACVTITTKYGKAHSDAGCWHTCWAHMLPAWICGGPWLSMVWFMVWNSLV